MEAMAISLALNKVDFPRPMTHDLLLSAIIGLGAVVSGVEITRVEEGTYFAELVLRLGDEERRIDSRPSDAIALAVRAEAPVFVAEGVLAEAGISSGESQHAVFKTDAAKKWTEELEKISADDFKYKM
jgi:bifunctional DNase/RNase